MENKQEARRMFTKEEILDETIRLLESLNIPVKYVRQMGNTIAGAVENLYIVRQCMDAEAQAVSLKVVDEKGNPIEGEESNLELFGDGRPVEEVKEVAEDEAEHLPEVGE